METKDQMSKSGMAFLSCCFAPRRSVNGRSPEVTLIKTVATLMVLLLHASSHYLYENRSFDSGWWQAFVADVICRPCVPWFFMATGWLLMGPGKSSSIGGFYKKRLLRLAAPFILWTGMYIFWRCFKHGAVLTPRELIILVIQGPAYYHLWFVYSLIGIYLAIPFLARLKSTLSPPQEMIWLGIWFVVVSILPLAERVLGVKLNVPLGIFGTYYGYVWLGDLSRRYSLTSVGRKYSCGLLVVFTAFSFSTTLYLTLRDKGAFNENLLVFLAPNIIIVSTVGYFLVAEFVLSYQPLSNRLAMTCGWIGEASFGIYLSHVLVMEFVSDVLERFGLVNQSVKLVTLFAATTVLTIMLVWVLGRMPVLNKLVK